MTHAVNPVLPTIATIIKTLLTSSGVEINVEVLDRPVFLKRIRERDLDAEGAHWIMTKPAPSVRPGSDGLDEGTQHHLFR